VERRNGEERAGRAEGGMGGGKHGDDGEDNNVDSAWVCAPWLALEESLGP